MSIPGEASADADAAVPLRPMPPPGLVLLVAVLAMSWGGPLVRYATAPALAVAAWRVALSVGMIGLIILARSALRKRRPSGRHVDGRDGAAGGSAGGARSGGGGGASPGVWGRAGLEPREWALTLCSGAFLACHFWSWIASLSYTTVASSVVLVSTQPVWVALLSALFLGERAGRTQWLGIGVAVIGAAVIGWGDFTTGTEPLLGDLLALGGAVFVALYYVIGRRLRQRLDLWTYTGAVYGVAAGILLLAAAAHPAVAVAGYPPMDWLVFLALAAGPMMIGHTGVNYALRYIPAYLANLALLGEPIGATLLAWWLPGIRERPSIQLLIGGALVLVGIGVGVQGAFGQGRGRSGHGQARLQTEDSGGRRG